MKIIQILTNFVWGDAIGNEVLAFDETLKEQGYESHIMACSIDETLESRAEQLNLSGITSQDLLLFHKATGDLITQKIIKLPCKKIMIYHNITPAKYFLFYDQFMSCILWMGRRQLHHLASGMDICWADSAFNAQELVRYGAKIETTYVLPILFSEDNTNKNEPNPETIAKLKSISGTKLLCIGRIAPNKKIEDAIKLYVHYVKYCDTTAVLFLVGGWNGQEKYFAKLRGFAADLKLREDQVVFTGKVTEEEKMAYLLHTDVLLCMSEHEGFCVPLLEAAKVNLPILAYKASAVPETLGNNGLLFPVKDYPSMAIALSELQSNELFRKKILRRQQEILLRFHTLKIKQLFLQLISNAIDEQPVSQEVSFGINTGIFLPKRKKQKTDLFFKPLWAIHNKTYKTLMHGHTCKTWKKIIGKISRTIQNK